jgi:predicted nuclease of predicted toxin-antitoxin system
VRLLLDQNLSPRLVSTLADVFPRSIHVSDVGLSRATDEVVWNYAAQHGYVIVSKDAEFHQRSFLLGHPPKVVWIRRGNCSTGDIETYCAIGTRTCSPSTRIQSGRSSRSPEVPRAGGRIGDIKPVLGPRGGRGQTQRAGRHCAHDACQGSKGDVVPAYDRAAVPEPAARKYGRILGQVLGADLTENDCMSPSSVAVRSPTR